MRIIGNTVGMGLPKPDLRQTDPRKGNYVYGKNEFLEQSGGVGGGLPAPAIAVVGKYIMVSAVDKDGHVTATVAVDPPTASGFVKLTGRLLSPGYIMAGGVSLSVDIPEEQEET